MSKNDYNQNQNQENKAKNTSENTQKNQGKNSSKESGTNCKDTQNPVPSADWDSTSNGIWAG